MKCLKACHQVKWNNWKCWIRLVIDKNKVSFQDNCLNSLTLQTVLYWVNLWDQCNKIKMNKSRMLSKLSYPILIQVSHKQVSNFWEICSNKFLQYQWRGEDRVIKIQGISHLSHQLTQKLPLKLSHLRPGLTSMSAATYLGTSSTTRELCFHLSDSPPLNKVVAIENSMELRWLTLAMMILIIRSIKATTCSNSNHWREILHHFQTCLNLYLNLS